VGTLLAWALASLVVLIFQGKIVEHWHIHNPAGLWMTLVVILLSLWMPLFWGVLQGQQNFLSLGWSMMLNGAGRLFVGFVAVIVFGGYAAGMMTGVALGMAMAAGMAAWQTRSLWLGPSAPFAWKALARELVPPMLGFAAFQFLFTADQMFVKAYFSEDEAGHYFSAGTLSRAMMWLVLPLASVMFPKIVHSRAKSENTNLVGLVLGGTALLAGAGALSLSVAGPLMVKLIYGKGFVAEAMAVLPWYAGAMVPLAVANVLLSTLLARASFKVVIPVCLVAAGYGFTLTRFHDTPVMVLKTLGIFNTLLLAVCGWFAWRDKETLKSKV
jgi:O-antigen/teichoic acid export membrane protein